MKIISNACQGGHYYKEYLKTQYTTPFIWCGIYADDMLKLMKNYNNIDFTKTELILKKDFIPYINKEKRDTPDIRRWNTTTGLYVDKTFKVFFSHNVYDPDALTPKIDGHDVKYRYNYKLTVDNWEKRTFRMLADKSEPIFFIITHQKQGYSLDICKQLISIDRKMVFITEFPELKLFETENKKVFVVKSTDAGPQFLVDSIKDFNIPF